MTVCFSADDGGLFMETTERFHSKIFRDFLLELIMGGHLNTVCAVLSLPSALTTFLRMAL